MKNELFKVLVETHAEGQFTFLLPCTNIEDAVEWYGTDIKVFDLDENIIYDHGREHRNEQTT